VWEPGQLVPGFVADAIRNGTPVLAHNAPFEAAIFREILTPHWGWPAIGIRQWRDSLAVAAALNLPLSLGKLGPVIGAHVEKDEEGRKLMLSLAKVRWDKRDGAFVFPGATPEQLARLKDYCLRDVEATLAVWNRLPELPDAEVEMIHLDREINQRGVLLDQKLGSAMRAAVAHRKKQLGAAQWDETKDLISVSGIPALKSWLADRAVKLPFASRKQKDGSFKSVETLDRPALVQLLKQPDLPAEVRSVLERRLEATRLTSLAKLGRVATAVCKDGRLRGALRYSKAHTGRWSSEVLQVHNLARTPDSFKPIAAQFRQHLLDGNIDAANALHPVLEGMSFSLRALAIASPGRTFVGGDYSAIEARILAWVAGQDDVLQMFASGADVYTSDAKKVGSDSRQFGKVQRLGLGYGMGAVKFQETASAAKIQLDLKRSREVVRGWRAANPAITGYWKALEAACIEAAQNPGSLTMVGRTIVSSDQQCLRIHLPSGRALHYWRPSVAKVRKSVDTVNEAGEIETVEFEAIELRFFTPGKLGMERETTYSGKLTENVVQAIARDVLRDALIRLKGTRFEVVLHVHDSICAEVDQSQDILAADTDIRQFRQLVASSPTWATDLPLSVDVYVAGHFKG
jgi:DNA polymerase